MSISAGIIVFEGKFLPEVLRKERKYVPIDAVVDVMFPRVPSHVDPYDIFKEVAGVPLHRASWSETRVLQNIRGVSHGKPREGTSPLVLLDDLQRCYPELCRLCKRYCCKVDKTRQEDCRQQTMQTKDRDGSKKRSRDSNETRLKQKADLSTVNNSNSRGKTSSSTDASNAKAARSVDLGPKVKSVERKCKTDVKKKETAVGTPHQQSNRIKNREESDRNESPRDPPKNKASSNGDLAWVVIDEVSAESESSSVLASGSGDSNDDRPRHPTELAETKHCLPVAHKAHTPEEDAFTDLPCQQEERLEEFTRQRIEIDEASSRPHCSPNTVVPCSVGMIKSPLFTTPSTSGGQKDNGNCGDSTAEDCPGSPHASQSLNLEAPDETSRLPSSRCQVRNNGDVGKRYVQGETSNVGTDGRHSPKETSPDPKGNISVTKVEEPQGSAIDHTDHRGNEVSNSGVTMASSLLSPRRDDCKESEKPMDVPHQHSNAHKVDTSTNPSTVSGRDIPPARVQRDRNLWSSLEMLDFFGCRTDGNTEDDQSHSVSPGPADKGRSLHENVAVLFHNNGVTQPPDVSPPRTCGEILSSSETALATRLPKDESRATGIQVSAKETGNTATAAVRQDRETTSGEILRSSETALANRPRVDERRVPDLQVSGKETGNMATTAARHEKKTASSTSASADVTGNRDKLRTPTKLEQIRIEPDDCNGSMDDVEGETIGLIMECVPEPTFTKARFKVPQENATKKTAEAEDRTAAKRLHVTSGSKKISPQYDQPKPDQVCKTLPSGVETVDATSPPMLQNSAEGKDERSTRCAPTTTKHTVETENPLLKTLLTEPEYPVLTLLDQSTPIGSNSTIHASPRLNVPPPKDANVPMPSQDLQATTETSAQLQGIVSANSVSAAHHSSPLNNGAATVSLANGLFRSPEKQPADKYPSVTRPSVGSGDRQAFIVVKPSTATHQSPPRVNGVTKSPSTNSPGRSPSKRPGKHHSAAARPTVESVDLKGARFGKVELNNKNMDVVQLGTTFYCRATAVSTGVPSFTSSMLKKLCPIFGVECISIDQVGALVVSCFESLGYSQIRCLNFLGGRIWRLFALLSFLETAFCNVDRKERPTTEKAVRQAREAMSQKVMINTDLVHRGHALSLYYPIGGAHIPLKEIQRIYPKVSIDCVNETCAELNITVGLGPPAVLRTIGDTVITSSLPTSLDQDDFRVATVALDLRDIARILVRIEESIPEARLQCPEPSTEENPAARAQAVETEDTSDRLASTLQCPQPAAEENPVATQAVEMEVTSDCLASKLRRPQPSMDKPVATSAIEREFKLVGNTTAGAVAKSVGQDPAGKATSSPTVKEHANPTASTKHAVRANVGVVQKSSSSNSKPSKCGALRTLRMPPSTPIQPEEHIRHVGPSDASNAASATQPTETAPADHRPMPPSQPVQYEKRTSVRHVGPVANGAASAKQPLEHAPMDPLRMPPSQPVQHEKRTSVRQVGPVAHGAESAKQPLEKAPMDPLHMPPSLPVQYKKHTRHIGPDANDTAFATQPLGAAPIDYSQRVNLKGSPASLENQSTYSTSPPANASGTGMPPKPHGVASVGRMDTGPSAAETTLVKTKSTANSSETTTTDATALRCPVPEPCGDTVKTAEPAKITDAANSKVGYRTEGTTEVPPRHEVRQCHHDVVNIADRNPTASELLQLLAFSASACNTQQLPSQPVETPGLPRTCRDKETLKADDSSAVLDLTVTDSNAPVPKAIGSEMFTYQCQVGETGPYKYGKLRKGDTVVATLESEGGIFVTVDDFKLLTKYKGSVHTNACRKLGFELFSNEFRPGGFLLGCDLIKIASRKEVIENASAEESTPDAFQSEPHGQNTSPAVFDQTARGPAKKICSNDGARCTVVTGVTTPPKPSQQDVKSEPGVSPFAHGESTESSMRHSRLPDNAETFTSEVGNNTRQQGDSRPRYPQVRVTSQTSGIPTYRPATVGELRSSAFTINHLDGVQTFSGTVDKSTVSSSPPNPAAFGPQNDIPIGAAGNRKATPSLHHVDGTQTFSRNVEESVSSSPPAAFGQSNVIQTGAVGLRKATPPLQHLDGVQTFSRNVEESVSSSPPNPAAFGQPSVIPTGAVGRRKATPPVQRLDEVQTLSWNVKDLVCSSQPNSASLGQPNVIPTGAVGRKRKRRASPTEGMANVAPKRKSPGGPTGNAVQHQRGRSDELYLQSLSHVVCSPTTNVDHVRQAVGSTRDVDCDDVYKENPIRMLLRWEPCGVVDGVLTNKTPEVFPVVILWGLMKVALVSDIISLFPYLTLPDFMKAVGQVKLRICPCPPTVQQLFLQAGKDVADCTTVVKLVADSVFYTARLLSQYFSQLGCCVSASDNAFNGSSTGHADSYRRYNDVQNRQPPPPNNSEFPNVNYSPAVPTSTASAPSLPGSPENHCGLQIVAVESLATGESYSMTGRQQSGIVQRDMSQQRRPRVPTQPPHLSTVAVQRPYQHHVDAFRQPHYPPPPRYQSNTSVPAVNQPWEQVRRVENWQQHQQQHASDGNRQPPAVPGLVRVHIPDVHRNANWWRPSLNIHSVNGRVPH